MSYVNDQGQQDTYWRPLPKTDDPAECIEYLREWWASKRESEARIREGDDPLLWGAMLNAEEDAITTLLDALCDTDGPSLWEARMPEEMRRERAKARGEES